ncbi:MAG: DNA primase [Ancalomicrobiaceae bacterium]|nr:DNA primase [Ancalomicrobiaceae bacterium]
MKFPPNLLDEIRARLSVSEVVGKRVRLRRQGREFAGLSPFNPEKTPSFFVNDQKGFYHCFSSGKHGDIFRFLMETEGLSFPEAVERLASEAGVSLPKPDAYEEAREKERATIADICEMAAGFFQDCLKLTEGQAARAYAERRKLTRDTIREFRIGYAPGTRDALKRHLVGKGVDEAAMIEAGLIIQPDDGRPSYDRFRNRLMIPIEDERGRVVAFGGRALSPEDQPKYLNSPETELFHKGSMLFNAHRARAAAHDAGSVTVVEGYLDAIAVYQAGVKSVVAALGTAFTEDHMTRLWRYAAEPTICFDGDKAGMRAANRAVDRILPLLKSGYSFNFAFLPDGKDPDELIQSGGKAAFLAEIARAVPLAEVLWLRETGEASLDTPERKAALEKRLEDLTGEIKDARVQRIYRLRYRLRLSQLFWDSERGPKGGRSGARQAKQYEALLGDYKLASPRLSIERILLGLTVEYPELLDKYYEHLLEQVVFLPDAHHKFLRELYRIVIEADGGQIADIYGQIDPGYYMVYDEVYGIERVKDGRYAYAWGHKLRERVPVLTFKPPMEFIEDYFVQHVDWLLLGQTEVELEQEFSTIADDISEAEQSRLITLKIELMRRHEEYVRRDAELADRARAIRQAYGLEAVVRDWRQFFVVYRGGPATADDVAADAEVVEASDE